MLDLEDFGTNPHAPEFADRGVLYVRWGKATKGSPPRRRSVLTVFPWSVAVLDEWLEDFRPLFESAATSSAVWPSERSARLGTRPLGDRFSELADEAGLPEELGMHCLRHSYVTHRFRSGLRSPLRSAASTPRTSPPGCELPAFLCWPLAWVPGVSSFERLHPASWRLRLASPPSLP
jgi:hypothetical protein